MNQLNLTDRQLHRLHYVVSKAYRESLDLLVELKQAHNPLVDGHQEVTNEIASLLIEVNVAKSQQRN